MRRRILIALVVLILFIIFRSCTGDQEETKMTPALRTITPEQIIHLVEQETHPLRLRTTRDVLPGGLSAAMAPMTIAWSQSDIQGPNPFVVLHNLNYGGFPMEGTTMLQSVKVPLDGVEYVEFVLVPLGKGGRKAPIHHGQLRFIFKQDRPMVLMNMADSDAGGDQELFDLVISWEAWRGPGAGYDVLTGMDADSYALSPRIYAGPQRFLEDALATHDWFASPLRLPGGDQGPVELLKVALALGDGVARHTISKLFEVSEVEFLANVPAEDRQNHAESWRKLEDLARPHTVTDDKRINLSEEEMTYQSVVRSCATIAHYTVMVAVERLMERGLDDGVDQDHLGEVHLDGDEPWMKEVSSTNLGGLVMRAPKALRWLAANPQAVPSKIPGRLDKAGLVKHEKGKPIEFHYSLNGQTPYGRLADNLIR